MHTGHRPSDGWDHRKDTSDRQGAEPDSEGAVETIQLFLTPLGDGQSRVARLALGH